MMGMKYKRWESKRPTFEFSQFLFPSFGFHFNHWDFNSIPMDLPLNNQFVCSNLNGNPRPCHEKVCMIICGMILNPNKCNLFMVQNFLFSYLSISLIQFFTKLKYRKHNPLNKFKSKTLQFRR